MKKCHKCHHEKSLEDFPKNKSKPDGRSETCLECKREYNRLHYRNNKSYYIDKAQVIKDDIRKWLQSYKVERGCKYCPEKHPACLHFHHRDPKQKEFVLARSAYVTSWERVRKEIEKCDVVCANCHAKIHWPGECDGSTEPSEGSRRSSTLLPGT